jgi:hypothetical protein
MELKTVAECIMVDTLAFRISDADTSRLPNKFAKIGGDDDAKWAKGSLETDAGKSSLEVRGVKSRKEFNVSGSPAFYRQGHNIISSNDVPMLTFAAAQDVNRELGLGIKYWRAVDFAKGQGVQVTRIDTPVMVTPPSGINIGAAINALALAGILAGNNTSLYVGKSVYFDQHSQLSALKAYYKLAEIMSKKRLRIPDTPNTPSLLALATEKIRLEPVYRQKYLMRRFADRGILLPEHLTPEVLAEMLLDLLDNYDLKRDIRKPLSEDQLSAIPRQYRPAASYWMHGYDVLKMLDNNKTEYSRCHGYLQKAHSINIYGPPPVEIEERIELGEILSPENFVCIPAELRADSELFFSRDMGQVQWELDNRLAADPRFH